MRPFSPSSRRASSLLAGSLALALVAGACGGSAGSTATSAPGTSAVPPSQAPAGTSSPAAPSPALSAGGPSLTPVPGGQTVAPEPVPTRIPTTQTDWGEILDALPDSFPLYPGAGIAEVPEGPLSGSFDAPDDAATVAGWYVDQLTARGYSVERSEPLEDGSITVDAQADLPECRIRLAFRPEAVSTIITVLVASACANGTQG